MKNGKATVGRSGPKGKFTEAEMGTLEVAVLSFVALSQANCAKEQKNEDLIAAVQAVIKDAAQGRAPKDHHFSLY